jgi:phosphoribosylanthranilate isomerase
MKLKVCGMKYPENIVDVAILKPDYMGFIFYPKSVRFVNIHQVRETIKALRKDIFKVGIFVNHPSSEVIEICQSLQLDFAQLHGTESPEYASEIKATGIGIIKVFHMDNSFDWNQVQIFSPIADFFLFDTSSNFYGGSGTKFDWELLARYHYKTPFFLSGGIDVDDIPQIKKLNHPKIWGIDINSRMESSPGFKNIDRVQTFINELKNEQCIPGK